MSVGESCIARFIGLFDSVRAFTQPVPAQRTAALADLRHLAKDYPQPHVLRGTVDRFFFVHGHLSREFPPLTFSNVGSLFPLVRALPVKKPLVLCSAFKLGHNRASSALSDELPLRHTNCRFMNYYQVHEPPST